MDYEKDSQIDTILRNFKIWDNSFEISQENYLDGWACIFNEKNFNPRRIVLYKDYETNTFSIKSFEIDILDYNGKNYEEIYSISDIQKFEEVLVELKRILFGKDVINSAYKKYKNFFHSS